MEYKTDIEKQLRINRPTLSDNSIRAYTSTLYNLYLKMYGEDPEDITRFNNVKKTLQYLKNEKPNIRKTILSGLYVVTKKPEYKDAMIDDIVSYDEEINKQEKTETQKNNWVKSDEIQSKLDKLKIKSNMAYKDLNNINSQDIQNYILLCLLSGKYIPPRRAKDYTEFKIRNIDKNKDNYLKGNILYFNKYKGSEKKGLQIISIPNNLKTILNKWIKVNTNDYLLYDKNNNKLSSTTLTQRLNKIFDSKISVNALRHTYLTDKHKDSIKTIDQLKKDMQLMGSSILQAKTYIKTN